MVRGSVGVQVPGALAGGLPVDDGPAVRAAEGVRDGAGHVRASRGGPAADAVHVGAVAVARAVLVPHRLGAPRLLDEVLRAVHVLGDEAAETVDPLGPVDVHPAVRGDDAGVGLGLEDVERPARGLDAHVVDLEHHVALHHAAHRVLAEVGESPHIALGVLVVGGDVDVLGQFRLGAGRGGRTDGVVVLGPGALFRPPEGAGRQELPHVDGGAERSLVEADSAQRVVELVAQEHAAYAEVVQLVQPGVDVGPVALGDVQDLLAAEGFGGLDAQDDRELALFDDLPGLGAVGDDAEPALARAAVHPVDVGLHVVRQLRLQPDRRHLVAAAVLEEVHGADHAVGDQVVHQDPLSAAPGPFDPGVVVLLVGQGVVGGPVHEGGPAVRIVPAVTAVGDEVEDRE